MNFKAETEDKHEYISYLFDKSQYDKYSHYMKVEVIDGKREERLKGMLSEAKQAFERQTMYSCNSLQEIMIAKTPEEQIMKALGFPVAGKMIGVIVCKNCLDRAISMIEENLNIMKDIRDSVK